MTQSEKRVLDKDAFDALELSALIHNGVGGSCVVDRAGYPLCLFGHSGFVSVPNPDSPRDLRQWFNNPVAEAIKTAFADSLGGAITENNSAVAAINRRKGVYSTARVTWEEYTKETGLTRGE